ncbi:GHMP family kinase ATP-binding protein [Streptomyces mirabilis]
MRKPASSRRHERGSRSLLEHYGESPRPGRWEYFSELEVGKRMASSTADIVATVRCLFNLYDIAYDQRLVTHILNRIERADSVFIDEYALYLSGRHQVIGQVCPSST